MSLPPSRALDEYTLGLSGLRARVDEAGGVSRTYGYDPLNRLTSETVTGAGVADYRKTFTYDPVGNRMSQVTTGAGAAQRRLHVRLARPAPYGGRRCPDLGRQRQPHH
jgi:YD repeat-containing protein